MLLPLSLIAVVFTSTISIVWSLSVISLCVAILIPSRDKSSNTTMFVPAVIPLPENSNSTSTVPSEVSGVNVVLAVTF